MPATLQSESARRVSACVTELLRKQPFFGSLALRLPLVPDPRRETLASDGREIRYSPRWVADSGAHRIEAAIARVVLACALKHHTRRDGRDPERWQHASQLVTHALLRDAGFSLPPDAEAWEGMSVEQAYDRLPEPDEDGENTEQPSGANDSSAADTPQPGDSNEDDTDLDSQEAGDDNDSGAAGQDESQDSDADSGEGGGNADGPASHDPAGTGEVMDSPAAGGSPGGDTDQGSGTPDLSAAGANAEEQAWDEAMHQAINLARAEGKLPGSVEETIAAAHVTRLDWPTLLRRHMTDPVRSDYAWSVPNLRFIDSGLYLPSIRSEGIDVVAVIVDTSRSLLTGNLAEFWAEVREIAAELRPERVVVLQVDTAVQHAAEYSASDLPDEIIIRGAAAPTSGPASPGLRNTASAPACACISRTWSVPNFRRTNRIFPSCGSTGASRHPAATVSPGANALISISRGVDDCLSPRQLPGNYVALPVYAVHAPDSAPLVPAPGLPRTMPSAGRSASLLLRVRFPMGQARIQCPIFRRSGNSSLVLELLYARGDTRRHTNSTRHNSLCPPEHSIPAGNKTVRNQF